MVRKYWKYKCSRKKNLVVEKKNTITVKGKNSNDKDCEKIKKILGIKM